MNQTNPSSVWAPAGAARSIAAAVGAEDASLAGAALQMLDRLNALVTIKDVSTGRYVHVNEPMAAVFGRSVEAMLGALDTDLMDTAEAAAMRTAEHAALVQETPASSDHRLERDGQRREFSVTRVALPRTDAGGPRHVMGVWLELTSHNQREIQLQQALSQLEQQQVAVEALRRESQDQALRDRVTGLYQRLHFDDQLRREVDLSSREHREFALVSIALDPPSESVRLLGAEARTRTLQALGQLLRSNTRAMDASCRLDEDRFAVLLSGVGLATAHSRMEGLRRQCATQIVVLDGRDIGFTVSMGVASFPHTAHTEEDLLRAADLALAEAQKRGGNHVTLASIRFEPGA
jgi:diguanylate cyclase (GGDEF)-like protein